MRVYETIDFAKLPRQGGQLPTIGYLSHIPEADYEVVDRAKQWLTGSQTWRDKLRRIGPFVILYLVTCLACYAWFCTGKASPGSMLAIAFAATALMGWKVGRSI